MRKGTLSIFMAALMVTSALFGLFIVGGTVGSEEFEVINQEDDVNRIELPKSASDHFTKNNGQWTGGLDYVGKTDTGYVGFDRQGVHFDIIKEEIENEEDEVRIIGHVIVLSFENSNYLRPVGVEEIGAKYNYLIGSEENWVTQVPNFNQVRYPKVWNGIDIVYKYSESSLKYDIILSPGADPDQILFTMNGQKSLSVESGSLVIDVDGEVILQDTNLDVYYQDNPEEKIPAVFKQVDKDTYTFDLSGYDNTRAIVIDPLYSSTYIGGRSYDYCYGVGTDDDQNTYVMGYSRYSSSGSFPTTVGAYDTTTWSNNYYDGFISKFHYSHKELYYSTFIGGYYYDYVRGGTVDDDGYAYITGYSRYYTSTTGYNYPTTSGAYQTSFNTQYSTGYYDAFVTKLSQDGSSLVFSTLLGSANNDYGYHIDVDDDGYVYAGGYTYYSSSVNGRKEFPFTSGAWITSRTSTMGYMTKFNPTGSSLVWSTFLGGSSNDYCYDVACDDSGNGYAAVYSYSTNVPVSTGAYQTTNAGTYDVVVAKLSSSTGSRVWASYLGGSSYEYPRGIDADSSGYIYVSGYTRSTNFPRTSGAYDSTYNGYELFVTKFDPNGATPAAQLLYSTYIGSTSSDYADYHNLKVNDQGKAFVAARCSSTNFPTTSDRVQYRAGSYDAVYFILDTTVSGTAALTYSTYLGGTSSDYAYGGMSVDQFDTMHVGGYTYSSNFPRTSGAFDTSYNSYDTYASILGKAFTDNVAPTVTDTTTSYTAYTGYPFTVSYSATDNVGVMGIYIEYWSGTGPHSNKSVSLVATSDDIPVANSVAPFYYFISAVDAHGNWARTSTQTLYPIDITGPTFSNPASDPYPPVTGGWANLTVDVWDNVAYNPSTVKLYYRESQTPTYTSVGMTHLSGDTFYYNGSVGLNWDVIYFYFEAYDYSNNQGTSITYFVPVLDNVNPTFVDDGSDTAATTGDPFNFNITMNDNVDIDYAYVEYWYGTNPSSQRSLSISGSGYGTDQVGRASINVQLYSMDNLYYRYHFRDRDGNWWSSGPSTNVTIIVSDNDEPILTNIYSTLATTGDPYFFSMNITDNIDDTAISTVSVEYTYDYDWDNSKTLPLSYDSTNLYWTSSSFDIQLNSLDPLTYHVTATDHQSNVMVVSDLYVNVLDNDDPVFNRDTTPVAGTTGDLHNFTVNVDDNIDIYRVRMNMEYQGGTSYSMMNMFDAGGGDYYLVMELEDVLVPITYNFMVIDTSGNYITTSDSVITMTDNDPPLIFSDMSEGVARAGQEDYSFRVMVTDNIELVEESVTLEYWFSYDTTVREVTMEELAPSYFYYVIDLPMQSGMLHYKYKATDTPAGLLAETDVVDVVILDISLPEIANIVFDVEATTGEQYEMSLEVTDDVDLSYVRMHYNFGDGIPEVMDGIQSGDTFSFTLEIPHNLDPLYFWFEASDPNSNVRASDLFMVPVIDNDLPEFVEDLSDTSGTTGDSVMLSVQVDDNIGIAMVIVDYMVPGGEWTSMEMMTDDMELFSYEIDLPNDATGDLSYYFTIYDTSLNMVETTQVDFGVTDDELPMAMIEGPESAYQFEIIEFTAGGSYDNVEIISYIWEINGESLSGPEVNYTFDLVGEYVIDLKVSDGVNPTVSYSYNITIMDAENPVIVLDVPEEIGNHEILSVDASGSTDNVGITSYSWLMILPDQTRITGSEEMFEYNLEGLLGEATLYLSISDAIGLTDSEIYMIAILDLQAPIVIVPEDVTIFEGTYLTFSDELSYDNIGLTRWQWHISFGEIQETFDGDTFGYLFVTHGVYNITLTAFDAQGNNATDFFLVTVEEEAMDTDSDGDGMPDWWEEENGLDKNVNDASRDYDKDLLTNIQEFELGTHPKNDDSDGDGLPDNFEKKYAYDEGKTDIVDGVPRWMNDFKGADDTDGDGDTNLEEYFEGNRNPVVKDAPDKKDDNTILYLIIALIIILLVAIIIISAIVMFGKVGAIEEEFPEGQYPHLYKKVETPAPEPEPETPPVENV